MAAGYRSIAGRWVGGLSAPGHVGGYRSRVGFWIGGLSAIPASAIITPPDDTSGIVYGTAEMQRRRLPETYHWQRRLREEDEILAIIAAIYKCY